MVVNGVCSPIIPVMSGVSQGILGPLLFITYINPVSNLSLSNEVKLTIYADESLHKNFGKKIYLTEYINKKCHAHSDMHFIPWPHNSTTIPVSSSGMSVGTKFTAILPYVGNNL